MPEPPAIETRDLFKTYKGPRSLGQFLRSPLKRRRLTAVDQVSLRADWGEMHALVGPNGAGKTTLLKLLCTLLLPERGTARIAGYDTRRQSGRVRAQVGLVVADERSFYWRLTGRHNLEFFAALHGLGIGDARRRTAEVAEQLGLADVIDKPFREYSTGMRQKLAIGRGILHGPRVLLLDEPTRGIDLDALRALRAWLREFVAGGGTALLASHDLAEIEALDCRVSLIDEGRLLSTGTVSELKRELGVADRYLLELDRLPASRPDLASIEDWDPSPEGTAGRERQVALTLRGGSAIGEVIAALHRQGVVVKTCVSNGANLEAVLDARRERESAGGEAEA